MQCSLCASLHTGTSGTRDGFPRCPGPDPDPDPDPDPTIPHPTPKPNYKPNYKPKPIPNNFSSSITPSHHQRHCIRGPTSTIAIAAPPPLSLPSCHPNTGAMTVVVVPHPAAPEAAPSWLDVHRYHRLAVQACRGPVWSGAWATCDMWCNVYCAARLAPHRPASGDSMGIAWA